MGKKSKSIDEYIGKSAAFAKPILRHLRAAVHKACPGVEEKMKWSFPHFDYQGMMCSMAAFKSHCVFGFWKAPLMKDPYKIMNKTGSGTAMGHFGRITGLGDLPKESTLLSYIREAANLNEKGVKIVRKPKSPKKYVKVPAYFLRSIQKNKKALGTFTSFSPSHKRDYVEWITEAKTEETRNRRMATAIQWLAKGRPRNWKYMKK